jgi:hypothetical protein
MRLLMLSLFILLAMVVLSHSQLSVHIGGNDGLALLKNLTKGSPNLTGSDNATSDTMINTTVNITSNITSNTTTKERGNSPTDVHLPKVPRFIGNGGHVSLKNLSNSSLNLTEANNTSNLWTWGGKPLPPPVLSAEDYFNYQGADVVKANRVE